jgi:hypothetical protein
MGLLRAWGGHGETGLMKGNLFGEDQRVPDLVSCDGGMCTAPLTCALKTVRMAGFMLCVS